MTLNKTETRILNHLNAQGGEWYTAAYKTAYKMQSKGLVVVESCWTEMSGSMADKRREHGEAYCRITEAGYAALNA